jgi:glutamyl-tRNA synthetase/glutamyl-Q tRNA(Asp) synthetase
VVNAIYVWGIARARGGEVLLRVEDHDAQRSRREYEAALLDDLDWLGFTPDVYPTAAFRVGPCEGRQSERGALYRAALEPLIDRGLVYACDCTRKQLDAAAYSGTCRHRHLPLGEGVGWRLRLDARDETFEDERLGLQRQRPAEQCGDVLVRDRLGNWTYQWAATTDDTRQGISHVIRGEDLLDSTGRQMAIARLQGRAQLPAFLHHPLVMKSATQKISKSDGDTGVRDLRHAGWSAPHIIGHAAALVGLQPHAEPMAASEVARLFLERR